jgi:hypothetical protein
MKIRNCGLLSYGTEQSKWSAQTICTGPTAAIFWWPVDRTKMLLQNIHNYVCTRLYTVSQLKPHYESSPLWVPQILYQKLFRIETLKEISRCENWITEQQYIFHTVFNITYFFHQLCTLLYSTSQKNKETNHFQYRYTFMIRTTYVAFQTSTTILPQGNLK